MKKLDTLDYLRLNKWQKFIYGLKCFIFGIPGRFANLGRKIWGAIKGFGISIWENIKDIYLTFTEGSWKTKLSFFIMGFGNIAHGQVLRGILFMLFEAVFIVYMIFTGGYWLGKFSTLGTEPPEKGIYDPLTDSYTTVYHDNSFKILLYGLLTILFIIAFIYTWRMQVKQCRINEQIIKSGKKIKSGKDDVKSLLDDQFHKTLLSLPVAGIVCFTVVPIIFMILVAFTNYNAVDADGTNNLFTWVGMQNFGEILDFTNGNNVISLSFGEILTWTLIWAVFATFTNYFLGMFVAMMINKKGIRLKKWWRTALVMTIAIPQFISLMYVSKLFSDNGLVNAVLKNLGIISNSIGWWTDSTMPNLSRAMVILINVWIGIPYLMLIATGILMNIPQDLYESAKIDGASGRKQFTKITLPYMLFVTGPYLLTSFTGNLNNFNVIFLLTGGTPTNVAASGAGGSVGYTDLLITWLFKLVTNDGKYYLASIIGIMIFVVVSIISLIVYNIMPSNKNEGDFS